MTLWVDTYVARPQCLGRISTCFLWKETSLGEDMPFYVFQTIFQPKVLGKGDSKGWYSL